MWYDGGMIDLPIAELLDDSICLLWLERHLHPDRLTCPHCGNAKRRLFREQGHVLAYHCRACEGHDTLLAGTVFEKTRQRPAALVLLWRGMAKGELPTRLARVRPVVSTAPYPTAAPPSQSARDRADRGDDRHRR
jgi:hypothetical protein